MLGKTRHLHAKQSNWTTITHHIPKKKKNPPNGLLTSVHR